ncbi:thiamine diphosphokinase [Halobacillus sp. KGW1]|uniref:thiamine diphosphokinase n=1 Tax=Halobacillus sp. KGW1 TaxID=1793726 RepID=UPI000782337A|nr:thiamine diphosphokinase [Halobacillus sp. KGW1]
MNHTIVVVGGGPAAYIPDLKQTVQGDCLWIGADKGAEVLIEQGIKPDLAIGDFDSVSLEVLRRIQASAAETRIYPDEKDETDLELAVIEAQKRNPAHILLVGVTGGRLDHSQANIQLLYTLAERDVKATIVDKQNRVELVKAGEHTIEADEEYPYISFLPVTLDVSGLTLKGFYYPLTDAYVPYGSTLCISNRLLEDTGTFSFQAGILLVIRSKDLTNRG